MTTGRALAKAGPRHLSPGGPTLRFLTPEWAQSVTEALAAEPAAGGDESGSPSLVAAGGRYQVCQVVHGAPDDLGEDGVVRAVLSVEEGRPSLAVHRGGGDDPADDDPTAVLERTPQVTVALAYDDAVALNRGEADAAGLLAAGRVRVRGDLAVLVAAQGLLAVAVARLDRQRLDVTY